MKCKDGTSDAGLAVDADDCLLQCDEFCGSNEAVEICVFSGDEFVTENIPIVTGWGLVAMVLLVLAAGTIVIARRQQALAR